MATPTFGSNGAVSRRWQACILPRMCYVLPVSVSFSVYIQDQPRTLSRWIHLQVSQAKRNTLRADQCIVFDISAIGALGGLRLNQRSKGGRCHGTLQRACRMQLKLNSSDYVYAFARRELVVVGILAEWLHFKYA